MTKGRGHQEDVTRPPEFMDRTRVLQEIVASAEAPELRRNVQRA